MKPLRNKVVSSVLACVAAASLASCGGGGSHSTALPQPAPTSNAAATYNGPLADATFTISIPGPTNSAFKRRPSYVSSATKSVRFSINTSTLISGATLTAFNARAADHFDVGTLPSATCPVDPSHAGNFICTVKIQLPPGTDNVTFTAYDNTGGAGNILSQGIKDFVVATATANNFTITLDANAATIAISGTQACTSGAIAGAFGTVGTSPVTLNVSYTDPATKTIVAPGLPLLEIQDNTATYQSTSGTINGTGGTVSFTINQSTQSFTLTPSTTPISNATVNVKAVPPSSDGLSFSQTHTFTFSTGTAQPASFLAVVLQTGSTGQINFYTVSLASGGPDTLTAYSTPTLATTTSINAAPDGQQPDVDNPQDVAFDSGTNLLISNGGGFGTVNPPDFGNFACVPAGAISTGQNLATTNRTGLRDPIGLAVASNGTVGLANNPAGAAVKVQEFTLGTNYAAGSSLADPPPANSYGVPLNRPFVNMPTLTAGTFAVGLYNGTHSILDILGPTGTVGTLTDTTDTHLQDPNGMDWDPNANQLVVADNNAYNSWINFYTVSNPPAAPVNVKSFFLQNDANFAVNCPGANPCAGMIGQKVAVSSAGIVAVAGLNVNETITGGPEIQLYDTAGNNRAAVANGIIPFDTSSVQANACGANGGPGPYTYGGTNDIIQQMRWLSNTKLLVLLSAPGDTTKQGIYIFDTSATAQPPGWWCPSATFTPTQPPIGPKQTGFLNTPSLIPHAAAFKP